MKRWLPQPLLSLSLVGLWLLLNNSTAAAQILLGALIALALPLFTVRFRPRQLCIRHPLKLMRYLLVLLWDITAANLLVARLIIGPPSRLRPAFIHLPVDLDNEFAIVVLTHTVSLTPGTVSADLSPDRRTLLIHVLDLDDEAQLVARIKQRYEAPLKEIFPC
jgi:multicomponent K+:H+ antiporter subunit E